MKQHMWKDLAYLVGVRNVCVESKSYSWFYTRPIVVNGTGNRPQISQNQSLGNHQNKMI